MATIRAYTTIEQSRKLAEILPLESADMYWKNGVSNKYIQCFTPFVINDYRSNVDYDYDIPCWSVGALLNVLPAHFYDKTGRKTLGMDKGDTYYNIFYENKYSYIQKSADNPVDACVDMIIHLNELNLL